MDKIENAVAYRLSGEGLIKTHGCVDDYKYGYSVFYPKSKYRLSPMRKMAPISGIVIRNAMWLTEENDELAVELFDQDLLHRIKKLEKEIEKLNEKRRLIKKEIRG